MRLGRNFWLYLSGQMISIIGDMCGSVALAWWILDATGSVGKVSTVLAPALFVQTILIPLLGPLGDRFSRKWLIFSADVFRAGMMALLAIMAARHAFHLPGVLCVYLFFAMGSALFSSNHLSIVPQLVSVPNMHSAVQMSQSMEALGRVLGGIVAGVLVSWVGVGTAFAVDAASFGIAALATTGILSKSIPRTSSSEKESTAHPITWFILQLRGGFRVIFRVPVLFWLCVAIALFNLLFNPMQVLIPAYAKQLRGMPAWFLGGLESSMGLGIILGAVTTPVLDKRKIPLVIIGLCLLGSVFALLSYLPGILFPMLMMGLLGIGAAWTNIPISTRMSVAMPDHYRSRFNSIVMFLINGTAPLGIAVGGMICTMFGVTRSMSSLGLAVLLMIPILYWIPGLASLFRHSPKKLSGYFLAKYPDAFKDD
jgi:DHA3 family macrolide efflux protein-like MFS transporter